MSRWGRTPGGGGAGRGAAWAEAAPRAFRLPGLSAVRGAGASSYAPHGGERVTPQSKRTHPLIYLHGLTETGNSRLVDWSHDDASSGTRRRDPHVALPPLRRE